jgi:hypothetical protein
MYVLILLTVLLPPVEYKVTDGGIFVYMSPTAVFVIDFNQEGKKGSR